MASTEPQRIRRGDLRLALIAAVSLFAGVVAPGAALAQSGQINLALLPVGQAGSFFDLTMRPGETRGLEVEIANNGDAALAIRTYAADVYTIINGGFGGSLRDEARTGATQWLDYSTSIRQLSAGDSIRRSLTVSVPVDTGPGEYISSILLENDRPMPGGGAVSLDQIVRQAIAVVVTVPGERSPALTIGEASHKIVAGRSIVGVAVANPGNVRLKPIATFVLLDAAGARVSEASVPMDTFYAHTATSIEVQLDALLVPGTYTVRLALDAVEGVRAEATATLVVQGPPQQAATVVAGLPAMTHVLRTGDEGLVPGTSLVAVVVGGTLLGGATGALLIILRRRRHAGDSER